MRIIVVGNAYGHIDVIQYYAKQYKCDLILSTGNLGLFYPNELKHKTSPIYNGRLSDFRNYILGKSSFDIPVYTVKGRNDSYKLCENVQGKQNFLKNFYLLVNGENISVNGLNISGLGGIYSKGRFLQDSGTQKYMYHTEYEKLISQKSDIVLLHDLVGGGGNKKRILFSDLLLNICINNRPEFLFVGQFDYQTFCPDVNGTNFIVCPGIGKGFHILDTDAGDLYFVKHMYHR